MVEMPFTNYERAKLLLIYGRTYGRRYRIRSRLCPDKFYDVELAIISYAEHSIAKSVDSFRRIGNGQHLVTIIEHPLIEGALYCEETRQPA